MSEKKFNNQTKPLSDNDLNNVSGGWIDYSPCPRKVDAASFPDVGINRGGARCLGWGISPFGEIEGAYACGSLSFQENGECITFARCDKCGYSKNLNIKIK